MQPGYVLRNRYLIQQLLASGYFGETYLAIDRDYYRQRYVIVKHLKPQSEDPAVLQIARRLFETEAMALSKLGDLTNRIPTLYAYFEEQNEFYLVQEFIEGQTLSQELTNGKLSTVATIHILREILIGLTVVHSQNTIHRDLKPDNIIRRSSDGALVLIDFGAVKEIRKATLATSDPTLASIGFGTEGYMPSEQARGFPKLASDVYAVGAIGIECLTGREPHQLLDEQTLEFTWQHLELASDTQFDPLLGQLVMVLNKMVQPRYLDRYANATVALKAIERLTIQSKSRKSASSVQSRGTLAPLDRAAFLKLLGLGSIGLIGSLAISQMLQHSKDSVSTIQPIGSGSIDRPTTLQLTSVKLNDRGEIIDRPPCQGQIFQEDLGNGVLLTMVRIAPGKFVMGSPATEEDSQTHEQPQRQVDISEFYLGQTQVTQTQWSAIFNDKSASLNRQNRLPAHSMNWLEAIDFCDRLSEKTGRQYRLPSESEWEYACRSHTTTPFAYGDSIIPSVVNYNGEHPYAQAAKGIFRQKATPVATFAPNLFGLYDMHGNLWEWCLDEWFDSYDGAPTDGSPWGNITVRDGQQLRVVRGGSWFSHARICRAASRAGLFALFRHNFYGMRVVCTRL